MRLDAMDGKGQLAGDKQREAFQARVQKVVEDWATLR
jgi:hypothetical protein